MVLWRGTQYFLYCSSPCVVCCLWVKYTAWQMLWPGGVIQAEGQTCPEALAVWAAMTPSQTGPCCSGRFHQLVFGRCQFLLLTSCLAAAAPAGLQVVAFHTCACTAAAHQYCGLQPREARAALSSPWGPGVVALHSCCVAVCSLGVHCAGCTAPAEYHSL